MQASGALVVRVEAVGSVPVTGQSSERLPCRMAVACISFARAASEVVMSVTIPPGANPASTPVSVQTARGMGVWVAKWC